MSQTGPRDAIADRLERAETPGARALAAALREPGRGGELPCWGAIAEQLGALLTTDQEWLELWEVLGQVDDHRALLVFIHAARGRPTVIETMLRGANRLSLRLQVALVCLEEAAPLVADHLGRLDPAVRLLWRAGPEVIERERRLLQVRLASLLASRFFVPLRRDPTVEPGDSQEVNP